VVVGAGRVVPSPGDLGALDVTLVGGLVAIGAPAVTAVAALLGYRMLSVWVPLLPGAGVFAGWPRLQVIWMEGRDGTRASARAFTDATDRLGARV
jgi:uncharacterized membrane protein YbhN (UPF0104 family)